MNIKRIAELVILIILIASLIFVCGINRKAHTVPQPTEKDTFTAAEKAEDESKDATSPEETSEPVKNFENYTPPKKQRELHYTKSTYDMAAELVNTFRYPPENSGEIIADLLDRYMAEDYEMGELWWNIMDYWAYASLSMELNRNVLPDGLPNDNSLCIVILGYRLEDDGSMSDELVKRLEVGLASAEKYPNAYIAVTGGGTAKGANNTEADEMAKWLTEHNVDPARLIIDNKALTTGDNAVNTLAILRDSYPQVKSLAIVSSGYHIPEGCLVFREVSLINSYCYGIETLEIVANACCDVGPSAYGNIYTQSQYVWSLADPKY